MFFHSSASEIESNFKTLTKNILGLAAGMSSNKEMRDFFAHLVEKITEPLKSLNLTEKEAHMFLKAYCEALTENLLLVEESVKRTLVSFMDILIPCVLAVY